MILWWDKYTVSCMFSLTIKYILRTMSYSPAMPRINCLSPMIHGIPTPYYLYALTVGNVSQTSMPRLHTPSYHIDVTCGSK